MNIIHTLVGTTSRSTMHTSKYYSNTKYAYYALRVIVLLGYELVLTLEYA